MHTGSLIKSNVTHVKAVKSAYRTLNTGLCSSCQRCQKCIQGPQYRVMLLVSKVSKVLRNIVCVKYCTMKKGSNAMYVKGVKSNSIYTIRAVMPMHVKGVKRTYTHFCS